MAYLTLTELENRVGRNALLDVADRDHSGALDPLVVERAISDAGELIDSYLAKRYSLPLAIVPAPLARIACDLAMHYLAAEGTITEDKRRRYDDAIKYLSDISVGRVDVIGAQGEAVATSGAGSVEFDSEPRLFTRRTMGRLL